MKIKMIQKLIYVSFVLLVLPLAVLAQDKVLEKSSKKKPEWVNATIKDFIITTGRGATIDEAKNQVVPNIRNEIMNSVAVYVRSKSEISIENENKNNVINTIEKFKNTSTVETADIPSLKGIALNKVSDFYWEKLQDKNNKNIVVAYHVKYPFSEAELQQLINEFKKMDQEMTDQLNKLIEEIETVDAIESIQTNIKQLENLITYFVDQRKEKAELTVIKYRDMLKSVEIVPIENNLGTLKYGLKIGEKFYKTSQKPKYTNSECVTLTSKISEGHVQIIQYGYEDCSVDDKNKISVSYKFGNNKTDKDFYFDVTSNKVQIFTRGDILMKASSKDDANVAAYTCDITLVSKYEAAYVIDKVILEWPGLAPVTISNIGKEFSGKGVQNLILEVNESIDLRKSSSKNKPAIDGTIFFKIKSTGETKRYKFYSQTIKTDW
jgi:septum formation topological specificity factor MinE